MGFVIQANETIIKSQGQDDYGKIVALGKDGKLDSSVLSNDAVNQKAFSNVVVNGTTIEAVSQTDTLELAAGTNIELTADTTNKKVIIAVTGKVASAILADTAAVCTGDADTLDGKHSVDFAIAGYIPENATETTNGSMSAIDKVKLDGIEAGAQVNQNTFSNVVVNGTTISADSQMDTIEFVAGTNIALKVDATSEKLEIEVTGKVASASVADKASNSDNLNGKSADDIIAVCSSYGIPVGAVQYFAIQTAPIGWLKADGTAVSRSTYADLFTAIGPLYGIGDGSTTFNLPDLRSEFIRGLDNGRGIDSNRIMGSVQEDATKTHSHKIGSNFNDYYAGTGNGGPFRLTGNDGNTTIDGHIDFFINTEASSGETETRPRNVALLACIKY